MQKVAYSPTKEDLEWAKGLISTIKDGGTWVYPATGLVFRFNHNDKTLRLAKDLSEVDLKSPFLSEMIERTTIVFGEVGYRVEIT